MTPFVQERLDRVLTQYRESPRLLALIHAGARELEEARDAVAAMPAALNLDTAEGEWLSLVGKRMGFGRENCVCLRTPVFGFECDPPDPLRPVTGFCDGLGTWLDCETPEASIYRLDDDEMYRRFLRVRARQIAGEFNEEGVLAAAREAFGDEAEVLVSDRRKVIVAPGEDFDILHPTAQLWTRVFPLPPATRLLFHVGSTRALAGFGTGWAGFCGVTDVPLTDEQGNPLVTEDGDPIIADGVADPTIFVCGSDPRIC